MLLIAVAVLGLHAVLCWLLLVRTRGVSIDSASRSFEIMLIPEAPKGSMPSPAAVDSRSHPKRGSQPPARAAGPTAPAPAQDHGTRPLVDWQAELARAAAEAAANAAHMKPKDFRYPQAETPAAAMPEFGWDYAHTHRVQTPAGGGLLVNLNDECALVFVPLPFVFCKLGRKPANGDLFRRMEQPSLTGSP